MSNWTLFATFPLHGLVSTPESEWTELTTDIHDSPVAQTSEKSDQQGCQAELTDSHGQTKSSRPE